ncbi:MAG: respiratory nitrate reductase subunit gamma [Candidatus Obscuribacterales bacterium]|nr:respiratory nitrate reductase subunit gamma [Candidatus Obscuribacterales bacterium]
MIDSVLFIALPYLAIFICIFGSIYRIRKMPMTYSALSSQFLESKSLVWGSVPWHIGIITIVLAHLFALICPGLWQMLMAYKNVLLITEALGLAMGICCLVGLIVLGIRRISSQRIQAVTSRMDLLVLFLLTAQVIFGIGTAVLHRWGAAWATGTAVPYIWSLFTLQPDLSYISDLPHMVKAHIVSAWLLILLVPFSRLIHMFAVPLHYLTRPPQNVLWNNPRHYEAEAAAEEILDTDARREFIKGGVGIAAGTLLLGAGAMDKIFAFFFGPRLTAKEETELMEEKLCRLQATTDQRKLELERQSSKYILVSAMSELSPTEGKYLIDYQMTPAMAFKGEDGLPIVLSAKCTHLGCTVGNTVNKEGKILCPCHVSYFDIKTGEPNADAPAKAPLPILGWALIDKAGKLIASRSSKGEISGDTSSESIKDCDLFIVKTDEVKV